MIAQAPGGIRTAPPAQAWTRPFLDALRPRAPLSVSEWAERFRVLPQKNADQPGPWRNALTPYLVEIMDSLGPDHPCRRVVFKKGSQVGGTECGNNWLGWIIDQRPASTLYVMPTIELAEQTSQIRIEPLITDTPCLFSKVSERGSRGGSTIKRKDFNGGQLVLTGANSGTGLRSIAAPNLFGDELDDWDKAVSGEGDPLALAERATRTFKRRKKVFLVSTPTVEGRSRIDHEFQRSDRSFYEVPCPDCNHYQRLRWANVKWDKGDPESVRYVCEGCGVLIPEHRKPWMLARGRWVAERPELSNKVRGFHLSALYSPLGWYSWVEAAEDWEKAQGDQELLHTFINTVLGECWTLQGDAPDHEVLMARAEPYTLGVVPMGALVLTAGCDVQKDRIEVEVVGWGPGRESWSIDYMVLQGETARPEVWAELSKVQGRTWLHESGVQLPILRMAVDSSYATQTVYTWVRARGTDQVLAIKGSDSLPAAIGQPKAVEVSVGGRKLRRGVKLWTVGSSVCKSELYGWLRLRGPKPGEAYPPGYCHLPNHPEEWFRQLCAEQLVPRKVIGRTVWRWEPKYERNEALDCRVYARAAAAAAGVDRWDLATWDEIRANLSGQAQTPKARRREGEERERQTRGDRPPGWFDRWR